MKKSLVLILVVISTFLLLIRFSGPSIETLLGVKKQSGLNVTSSPEGATVFLDEVEVGTTPYENKNLEPKEYNIEIQKDQMKWQGNVKLVSGTVAVINRDLSFDSPAGEVLILISGRGITVISNPSDADLEINGKPSGKTPLTVNLESGEYTISLSRPSYLKRSIKATLPPDYNLVISSDLALSEADLTAIQTPVITATPTLLVLDTPTGFLRVRDKPSLAGKEIAQVKPGDTLILLEELPSWVKVRLSNGIEGYTSSTYVKKQETPDE